MLNILTEPLIRVDQTGSPAEPVALPETYALLMADKVDAFPALRPHQRHAWHSFLVQLAAMALHRAGQAEPPDSAAEWTDLLRGLTPDYPEDEPWQLVIEDITKPAFMQPPASTAGKLAEYKNRVETPDELDMLVTSKNHELKSAVAELPNVDDWLFALITLQTMAGFDGAGNYGISRMNGGFGSRPAFSIAPSQRPGPHLQRDIKLLLGRRPTLLDNYPMFQEKDGIGLLWAVPWDGAAAEALTMLDLDLFYIEVCRRIRLGASADAEIYGLRTTSKAARIEAKALNGITGDPWAPIDRKNNKCLTMAARGFTYNRITNYLTSPDWRRPELLSSTPAELSSTDQMQLVARAMVRGGGKTEGYYERFIPLRQQIRIAFGSPGQTQELGDIARERIQQIGLVQRILSHSIQVFAARGDQDKVSPEHRRLAGPWLNRLDEIVDARFFDDLQDEFEAEAVDRRGIGNKWLHDVVIENARKVLHEAQDSLPCPAIHRYRARVRSDSVFEGRIRGPNGFPDLFNTEGGE